MGNFLKFHLLRTLLRPMLASNINANFLLADLASMSASVVWNFYIALRMIGRSGYMAYVETFQSLSYLIHILG